ncbi:AAA family ATPase [Paenibacillus solisilvae]|uniref:Nuclease SbcCD subunit C n=1 Tax=Paenibacillus solisilvae TaxID=2486751 RepID=A0ABW0W1J6_9BACL
MKPIMLRLSGLQSYREAQEVDFERLCEAGVFGIFGPTGSGKSSILDAVTLALYGKVERAANGTQGIMNQAEKQLAVAFTFELAGAGEKRRYRVERQFKRSGDVTVNNSLSRFVEITETGDVVLADKLAEVTRFVEERIGLNMQDFTRAVVLPQGKFAEFLSLTGKERRSMLQRLFRLERFGDGLALKLSQRMKAAEAALNEAAAEQLGLGDASAAAVDAAAERYREAAAAQAAARTALAVAEQQHAERLQVRERLEALRTKEAMQAKLHADAPRIAALARELQRLAAAERLAPALAAAGAAEAALRAAASRREAAGLAHAARLEAATAAAAAFTAAAAEAAAAEPRLALRLDQLAGAQRLEGEAAALAASTAAGEHRYADASARQRSYGELAAAAQDKLGRAAAKQSELKAELKTIELTAADRDQRNALSKRLQLHDGLKQQLDNTQREAAALAEQNKQIRLKLEASAAKRSAALHVLARDFNDLQSSLTELHQLEQELQHINDCLPEWLTGIRTLQREQHRQQLAAQLADELKDGEACPVCGSCTHPLLQGNIAEPVHIHEADEAIASWEKLLQQAQKLLLRAAPLRSRVEAALERSQEIIRSTSLTDQSDSAIEDQSAHEELLISMPSLAAVQASLLGSASGQLEAAAASETIGRSYDVSAIAGTFGAIASALAQADEICSVQDRLFTAKEAEWSINRKQYSDTVRQCELIAGELHSSKKLAAAAGTKHQETLDAWKAEITQWQVQFGDAVQLDQAHVRLAELDRRDQSSHELRTRLDRSVSFIEETAGQLKENEKLAQAAQLEAVELSVHLASQRRQLDDKYKQLLEWTGGTPAVELIAAAEKELAALRDKLQKAKQAHETVQTALNEAAEQRSAAVEAEQTAIARHEEAEQTWSSALSESPFESADEVSRLQPLLAQQERMLEDITRYREAEQQLAAQIELLRDQLQGRSLTDEEWEQCVTALHLARSSNEAALQTEAKAERDLEELKAKQNRWNALEEKRAGMEQLTGRLKSLQTVFRGNAFVEYVAEEQLVQVCRAASERLGFLTKRRYALEVDSGGGFVIRDDANGGIRRPVSTLSGGETFLASLALALALSGQIQLRGKYPLQFFFLDEGFGTLDPELLDTVITALEKLHNDTLSVGVISHVPELRARLPRRLIVSASEPSGRGSMVELETM